MARLGRGGFLTLAVVFHFTYLWSIFDVYFVSPIVHGMQAHSVQHHSAPAQRLFLFVGDGLRADKAFQSFPDPTPQNPTTADLIPRPLAPFLRSRILEHGTFGVSHTRVPTESRPGHVALIAGLYEDVSAVTTGWKINPVDFDSVFNRSRHTWSWGSPDIVPMFSLGAVPGRVDADHYSSDAEDFTKDAALLDIWVFDKVKALFEEANTNTTLNSILRQDKLVFFLHLLGLDTAGHAHRPYSKEYLNNIKVVDKGVQEIYELVENFYADGKTSYVFTADHGMSDFGSHGDGHPDSTRTPLIAWGAGVAKPVKARSGKALGHEDGFSSDWGLDHIQRHDVAQADIAPLMSYLAGLDFPVNSVGELPLSYLSGSKEEKAHAALVNAKEVLEMYRVKEDQKKATALQFKPFTPFATPQGSVETRIAEIQTVIQSGKFDQAIGLSQSLLKDALQGLRYLQTYDWLFLRALVTMGYLGWIAYGITTVIDVHVLHGTATTERSLTSSLVFSSILVLLYSSFIIDKSPLSYYAYAFFPVLFWEEVYARKTGLVAGLRILFGHVGGIGGYLSFIFQLALYVGILEALVQSYFHRTIFTACYIIGAFWPLTYGLNFVQSHGGLVISWMGGCFVLSTFTILPVVKIENADTVSIGGLLMFAAGAVYLMFENTITALSKTGGTKSMSSHISRSIMGCQLGVIGLTIFVTRSSITSIQSKQGLPLGNQVTGWLVLISSLILPFVHRISPNNHYLHRLVVIFLAFSPSFIILTISYEGLFYFAFSTTLLSWVRLEHAAFAHVSQGANKSNPSITNTITSTTDNNADLTSRTTYRTLTLPDLRTALFFLFLLQSAYFSTGNIASIATFSLDAVYRLIPVFDPFSQGALLMFKIVVPFACISAALGILNRRLGLQSSALFMVVMSISDVMTLNFFWMVRDEGSWLDIGTTISHFVIGSLMSSFVAGLEVVSESLISGVEVEGFEEAKKVEGGVEVIGNGTAKSKVSQKQANGTRPVID